MTDEPRDDTSDDDLGVFLNSDGFLDSDDMKVHEGGRLFDGELEGEELESADLPTDSTPVGAGQQPDVLLDSAEPSASGDSSQPDVPIDSTEPDMLSGSGQPDVINSPIQDGEPTEDKKREPPPSPPQSSIPLWLGATMLVGFLVIIMAVAFIAWEMHKLKQRTEGKASQLSAAPQSGEVASNEGGNMAPPADKTPADSKGETRPVPESQGATLAELLQLPVTPEKIDGIVALVGENRVTQEDRPVIEDWAANAYLDGNLDSENRAKLIRLLLEMGWFSRPPVPSNKDGVSQGGDSHFYVAMCQQPEVESNSSGLKERVLRRVDDHLRDPNTSPNERRVSSQAKKVSSAPSLSTDIRDLKAETGRLQESVTGFHTQVDALRKQAEMLQEKTAEHEQAIGDLRLKQNGMDKSPPTAPAAVRLDTIAPILEEAKRRLAGLQAVSKAPLEKRTDDALKKLEAELPIGEALALVGECQAIWMELLAHEMNELVDENAIEVFLQRLDVNSLKPLNATDPKQQEWNDLVARVDGLKSRLTNATGLSASEASNVHVELAAITDAIGRLYSDKIAASLPKPLVQRVPEKDMTKPSPKDLADSGEATKPPIAREETGCDVAGVSGSEGAPGESQQAQRNAEFDERLAKLEQVIQDQVTGVGKRVLETLAGYGYVPPSGIAPDSSAGAPDVVEAEKPTPDPKLASQAFAYGIPAFFSQDPVALTQAFEQFRIAVKYDPDDPVYRYFLALTLFRQGRVPEASAQAYAAVKRELGQYDRQRAARSLERIQGPLRAWLEEQRVNAFLRH